VEVEVILAEGVLVEAGKPKARIDLWRQVGNFLMGRVYGHPTQPDGKIVATSELVKLEPDNKMAETENTIYELGRPYEG
jgi:hypothetical protein